MGGQGSSRGQFKCDGTRAETRFRLPAKRTSTFKSAGGRQFSRLLAAEVCASAVVTLDTPCSEVVWRVLAAHCIRQFPFHFPCHASACAITFQPDSTATVVLPPRKISPLCTRKEIGWTADTVRKTKVFVTSHEFSTHCQVVQQQRRHYSDWATPAPVSCTQQMSCPSYGVIQSRAQSLHWLSYLRSSQLYTTLKPQSLCNPVRSPVTILTELPCSSFFVLLLWKESNIMEVFVRHYSSPLVSRSNGYVQDSRLPTQQPNNVRYSCCVATVWD